MKKEKIGPVLTEKAGNFIIIRQINSLRGRIVAIDFSMCLDSRAVNSYLRLKDCLLVCKLLELLLNIFTM